ncbi:hypothetical protein FOA52_004105 [Chlamydomonas sp. UWO 241]|nr:hypothetical protein FOA52_004105 [Chlamydomonas sp. UWO 241]
MQAPLTKDLTMSFNPAFDSSEGLGLYASPQDAHAPASFPSAARPVPMALLLIQPQQAAAAPDRWGDTDPSKYVSGSVAVAQGQGQGRGARWADARDQDPPAAQRSQQRQQPASSSFLGFPQQQQQQGGGGGGAARSAYQAASGPLPLAAQMHAGAQAPQQPQGPPGRGTRSGPYSGFASGKWLEVEMREEVDDLAHAVDQAASKRYEAKLQAELAAIRERVEAAEKTAADANSRAIELEALMPDEDGNFRALRRELKELEADSDFYYKLYVSEKRSREDAQKVIGATIAHLGDIDVEFARIKKMVEDPEAVLAQAKAQANADIEAAYAANAVVVTPEMVLAAEQLIGRRKSKWPNYRTIFVRLLLVGILLGCIAASILATYFLTRKYDCR